MRLIALHVRSFRGIGSLDWTVEQPMVCLVGPGDTGKTAVLDAIEWALSPRWALPVSDADFHQLSVDEPIVIEATVAEVPPELLTHKAFDVYSRYRCKTGDIHDEPLHDDDQPVLTVRLTIDATLEPEWHVVCGDRQEARPITHRQRMALGVSRLGGNPDRHLRWGRGSALERLTESIGSATQALASVYRAARAGVAPDDLVALADAVETARLVAPSYGAGVDPAELDAAIDPASFNPTAGALGLQIANVPLATSGLGTRRLVALALQAASVPTGAIMLVDEVESGLEPHRLRHLLQRLRTALHEEDGQGSPRPGQVIMTTHSPVALVELSASDLHVARRDDAGSLTIHAASDDLQGLIRKHPEAMLATSVIVGEGATEHGLVRGLDGAWSLKADDYPLAQRGIAIADGGGNTKAPMVAMQLTQLGYRTALVVDDDRPISPDAATVQAEGVHLTQWGDGMRTEQRLATDLPITSLIRTLGRVAEERGSGQVRGDIAVELGRAIEDLPDQFGDWPGAVGEGDFRKAAAAAMTAGSYIKRIDIAEEVGVIVAAVLDDVPGTDLADKVAALRRWCGDA